MIIIMVNIIIITIIIIPGAALTPFASAPISQNTGIRTAGLQIFVLSLFSRPRTLP